MAGGPAPALHPHPGPRAAPAPDSNSATPFAPDARATATIPTWPAVGAIAVRWFAQDAAPTLFASTAPIAGASYAGPGGHGELSGPPKLVGRSDAAMDFAARLWETSEQLTGVSYPLNDTGRADDAPTVLSADRIQAELPMTVAGVAANIES